jgi:phage tail sheath protein FI
MPVQVTYPGVYIQEIPSGSHTISGVATSITAFMGRALRGPLGSDPNGGPITIFSFQDYVNIFGGLSHDSPMSYAVNDFFLNGGGQAIIVRLFEQLDSTDSPGSPGDTYTAEFTVDAPTFTLTSPPFTFTPPFTSPSSLAGVQLQAASPGKWGNYLVAQVDVSTPSIAAKVLQMYAPYGVLPTDPLFNLTLYYNPPSGPLQSERFLNMTVTGGKSNPNRIDRVLQSQSMLARTVLTTDQYNSGDGGLTQNWLNDWIDFNQAVASNNLNQKELLGILPGPNSSGGVPVSQDSDVITSDSYGGAGTKALDQVDLFNLLCVPPDYEDLDADTTAMVTAANLLPYCVKRRAVMILDPLIAWGNHVKQDRWDLIQPSDYNISGDEERNAAVYFPRVIEPDPLMKNQPITRPPCGIIAGNIAATDLSRGVWKAPAGIETGVNNILSLEYKMTDDQNGVLNPLGINCLRTFPVIGTVVWGARTLRGADELEDDYKYLNVRRLTLYIEESLYRGTKWAVFEPHDSTLWGALATSSNAFLAGLQRQGAFYSYFVQCDATTTTPTDINLGIVNLLVGIAPVKPAEFVVISIQQLALQPSS